MTEQLHLKPKHREVLEALFREHLPDVEVWAFGSRVNGRSHDGSDLDLVLRGPGLNEIPVGNVAAFEEAVRESTIPFLVEARDWTRLPERFHREIRRRHVVLAPLGTTKAARADGVDAQAPPEHSRTVNPAQWTEAAWSAATIEEISEKVAMGPFGSSIKVETFVSEGIPIISGQHLRGVRVDDTPGFNFITPEHATRLKNANVGRGDVVFTHAGNIGQVAYIPSNSRFERYIISQRQFYMRCDQSKVIPDFVALYFTSSEGQHKLLANASQVGVPSIAQPVTYLRTIEIPLPLLPEQRAIAGILGALDDKIALNRRMNQTLEAMARALFKDWFVDFGPVRAKMAGRAPYLAPEIWKLFPDMLDGDGKPVGWTVLPLGERIEILDSRRIPLSSRERKRRQGPYPYHGATGVMGYVDDYLFEGVHVLLGEDGSVTTPDGKPFTQYVWGQFWVNNHAHVLKGSGISNEMLLCFLRQTDVAPYVTGAVQPKLNQKNLKTIPFSSSDINTPAAFDRVVKPFFRLLRRNCEENCTLIQMRDLLLPKLMSGEIRLRDAEKVVEAVA